MYVCGVHVLYSTLWNSDDNVEESVLFFHNVGPGTELKQSGLMPSALTCSLAISLKYCIQGLDKLLSGSEHWLLSQRICDS